MDRLTRDQLLDRAARLHPVAVIQVVNDSGAAVHVVADPVAHVMAELDVNEVDARQAMREQGVDPESAYMVVNELVTFDDPMDWRWIGCVDAAEAATVLVQLLRRFPDGDLRAKVEQIADEQ